jgi:hypothetical protein
MATKFKRAVALCLAILTFCSTFFVSVAASDTKEQLDAPSVITSAIASAKELLGTISYEEYNKLYSEYNPGAAEIVINALDYIADATLTTAEVGKTTYDGIEALDTGESGVVSWKVNIPADGMYAIGIDYWPTAANRLPFSVFSVLTVRYLSRRLITLRFPRFGPQFMMLQMSMIMTDTPVITVPTSTATRSAV